MRKRGLIRKWNDQKGFGFIGADGEAADVFFHAKALRPAGVRPAVGDAVTFELGTDERQRPRALAVRLEKNAPVWSPRSAFTCLAAAFIAALVLGAWLGRIPSTIPTVYVVVSIFTAAIYASDKTRAGRAQWRTSEKTLHLLELCGGWPGALIAQHWIRHKVGKPWFQVTFWLIVLGHLAVWAWLAPRVR